MPPKKRGNKSAQDDWEAELGESIAPPAAATPNDASADADGDNDDNAGGSGGLMAMLRKNKEKRKKKGLQGQGEDVVQGENPPPGLAQAAAAEAPKAPEEASTQEVALPKKKGKDSGKAKGTVNQDKLGDEAENGGKILTRAEKEKLRKEREKQRKKEQLVSQPPLPFISPPPPIESCSPHFKS